mgnify:CR=1 FL=1
MSYLNFPRILLCVMNDGVDLTTGKRFVEGSGHFKDMKSFEELPVNCQNYIRRIEELIHCPIVMFSVGPDREQTVVLKDIQF